MFFVLARILAPADIGSLIMVSAIILLVQVSAESTLAEYVVQEQNILPAQVNSIFWGQITLSTLAALLMASTAPWWAKPAIGHAQSVEMTQALSAVVAISGLGRVPDALLRSQLKYKQIALRSLISVITGAIVGLAAALLGFGVWSLIAKQLTESTIECLANFLVTGWRPSAPTFALLAEPVRYGMGLVGIYGVSVLNSQMEFFVIGAMLGPTALGLYGVSNRISQTVHEMFAGIVSRTSVPIISKGKVNPLELRSLHLRMLTLVTIAAVPIYAVLFAVSHPTLVLLAGDQWSSGTLTMQILCVAGPISVASSLNTGILVAVKRTGIQFRLSLANLLLSAVLLYVCAHWSLEAVACGSVLRMAVMAGVGTYAAMRVTGVRVRDILGALMPSLLIGSVGGASASIVMALSVNQPYWLQLIGSGGVACLAMTVALVGLYRKQMANILKPSRRGSQ